MSSPRYIMIGGFLGAGKTTAILRLAELLRAEGSKVGLITNDQSYGLVDTKMLTAHALPVAEITGGCFCCRFNSLVDAAAQLAAESRPDVFLAEPVGSCTDLKATVDYPLRRMYGDQYSVAPYSVLVDPIRAARVLGLETGKSFSDKVRYIYGKQLEEADLIVINKVDLLTSEQRARLEQSLAEHYPRARIRCISARNGTGIEAWLDELRGGAGQAAGAMDVDYDLYADGEALLGWLNGQFDVRGEHEFDGNTFVLGLAETLHRELTGRKIEVAHLKMTLAPEQGADLAVVNLVRGDARPESSHRLQEPLLAGELTLNLRAEGSPEELRLAAEQALAAEVASRRLNVQQAHLECFRPGRPTPTHRLAAV